jgi:quinol-cytochrome oxidoreductase complex cytochrome b subunit
MSDPAKAQFEVTATGDARAVPIHLLVVQGDERPPVDASDEPQVMTFPHLLVRELIAFLGLSIVLITLALLFDAPLEEIADPTRTPNPAKAPWYFLGLQEMLHYYPPLVSGVVMPGLLITALAVVPYFDVNLERGSFGKRGRGKPLALAWVVVVAATVTFMRALCCGMTVKVNVYSTNATSKCIRWLLAQPPQAKPHATRSGRRNRR